jgi:mycothiol system anti-sigma-R factor
MNCSEAQTLLYDYLNGELEQLDLSRVESHLKVCSSCLRIFEFERRFQSLVVDRITGEKAPPELKSAILDRIGQLEEPKTSFPVSRRRPLFRPALVLAPIGLVVVFLAIVLFSSDANRKEPVDILLKNHIRAESSTERLTYSSSDPQFVSSHLERELGFRTSLAAYVGPGAVLKGGEVLQICNCKVGLAYFSTLEVGISLFICRQGELTCPEMETLSHDNREYRFASIREFNLLVWQEEGLEFIAVSRDPREALLDFAARRA